MGLFSAIKAINATANLVNDLASNEQVKSALFDTSVKGLKKLGSFFDTDDDGDFDINDLNYLLEYAEMIASILGNAALADGIVNEEEEEEAWAVLQRACFEDGGILTNDILETGNLKKKDIKTQLTEKFNSPFGLKKISRYAIEKELEEDFYEMACIVVSADKIINDDEKDFLKEFSESLEMSKFDTKRINKKYLIIE